MRGFFLWFMVCFFPCMFAEEIAPAKGDLNEDGVADAVDTVLLANYQVGNLDTLYAAGDFYQVDSIVGVLRYVPGGTFQQGRGPGDPCNYSNETPFIHTLKRNLAVMQTEVTRRMWAALKTRQASLPADPTYTPGGAGMDNPVQQVTWRETVLFANLLSVEQGRTQCYYSDAAFTVPIDASNYWNGPYCCDWSADGYRLLTEGEWEYVCRAGTKTPFYVYEPNFTSCSDYCTPGDLTVLERVAWFCANLDDPVGDNTTKPAGLKKENPWGFQDVHGNVWEWCWDWYGAYPSGPATDYRGMTSGSWRVMRGGSFYNGANGCRSAIRNYSPFDTSNWGLGFRLCRLVE